jgi:hypothetical protein
MRVQWAEEGLDRLADIYVALDLDGQDEIARVVSQINATLATDPWDVGESRATANQRSWHVDPLTVLFEIFPDEDMVLLQHVATKRPK